MNARNRSPFAPIAALFLLACLAPTAQAGPYQFIAPVPGGQLFTGGNYRNLHTSFNDSGHVTSVGIFDSALLYNGHEVARYSVCNDLSEDVGAPVSEFDYVLSLVSASGNPNRGKVAWLLDNELDNAVAAGSAVTSAGFQAAIWELWYDTSPDLSSGAFYLDWKTAYGGQYYSQAVVDRALNYINSADSEWVSASAIWLSKQGRQDQLMTLDGGAPPSTVVPEPAFWQMGAVLALGAIPLLRRRRRA
ncbi:MAG: hypothetical protein IT208_14820 [Chthonomonadales bacterium]|nr:hypothetical protein [Chthonomonadales bacterium]